MKLDKVSNYFIVPLLSYAHKKHDRLMLIIKHFGILTKEQ